MLRKFVTRYGETILINPAHIISVRNEEYSDRNIVFVRMTGDTVYLKATLDEMLELCNSGPVSSGSFSSMMNTVAQIENEADRER
jgi:hypothetical protein